MRLLKTIFIATLIIFAIPSMAVEVECKRYDNKCLKAKNKAEKTQAIFMIFSVGREKNWDWKLVRDSFAEDEIKFLKDAGFDIKRNANGLVRALKKSYDSNFEGMDDQTWNHVMTSIMADDYIAKQVAYKKLGVDVITRLKEELENSGKKTVKAKSGNFSTRSSSRPAVVVLDALESAQMSLIRKLEKANGEIQVEVIAKALNDATIILVERGHVVAKPLYNPKQLEKTIIRAAKSSAMPVSKIIEVMAPAAAPAMEIIQNAAKAKTDKKVAEIKTKQIKLVSAESHSEKSEEVVLESIIEIAVDSDGNIAIPELRDYEGFTIQEIREIAPEASDEDYIKMQMDYFRHAKMLETDSIAAEGNEPAPGVLYANVIIVSNEAGSNGAIREMLGERISSEVQDLWSSLKNLEARTQEINLIYDQDDQFDRTDLKDEGYYDANGKWITNVDGLTNRMEHQAEESLKVMKRIGMNSSFLLNYFGSEHDNGATARYLENVLTEAEKAAEKALRSKYGQRESEKYVSRFTEDFSENVWHSAEEVALRVINEDKGLLWSIKGSEAMATISIAEHYQKDAAQFEAQGLYEKAEEARKLSDDNYYRAEGVIKKMLREGESSLDVKPALSYLKEYFDQYGTQDHADGDLEDIQDLEELVASADDHVVLSFVEQRLAMDEQATLEVAAELQKQMARIDEALKNLDSVAESLVQQGASESEAAAYIADQQAQMQAAQQQICSNGDPNNGC